MPAALQAWEWEALQMLETLEGADSLLDFVPQLSPKFRRPNHLRQLAEVFVRMEHEPVRVISNVPPQHAKSYSIFHWLVRYLLRFPEKRCAYVTYSIDFAKKQGRRLLEVADASGLQIINRTILGWNTTAKGGVILTGINGSLTGNPVDGILIIDDPHKDRAEAESATIRASIVDWFNSTATTRLHPCASIVVNSTRWHMDDLPGYLLTTQPDEWQHINLPALDASGEALWPEERPLWFLEKARRTVGEYEWASLYMGEPRTRGSQLFNEPARYDKPDIYGAMLLIACDPAATASTSADHTAIAVGAGKIDGNGLMHLDILDMRHLQVTVPTVARELRGVQTTWGCPVVIEAVGAFKAVGDMLRELDPRLRIIEITPRGDKFVRAQRVAAAWNDGRVRVPLTTPWVAGLINEVATFTGVGDRVDDQVDALAHLFNTLEDLLKQRARRDQRPGVVLPFG